MINFDLQKYLTPVFVETGIGGGDGITKALKAGFQSIISIEISKEVFDDACLKFHKEIENGRVCLFLGDSALLLEGILSNIVTPITFWLDAHIDSQKSAGLSPDKCPLFKELAIIDKHFIDHHIIMINDVRLFKDNELRDNVNGWGNEVTEEGVRHQLIKNNPKYSMQYENGFIADDILVAYIPCDVCGCPMFYPDYCEVCFWEK